MSELISTKPYMVRAIHEWCVDNALTPHLLVVVNAQTRVPMGYVKNGEIVLNLNYTAIKDLHIDNDAIVFSARFGGVGHNIYVPMGSVKGVFARENGQGMFFEVNNTADTQVLVVENDSDVDTNESAKQKTTAKNKASLRIVK
jgi:stringent starvation protein B